MQVPSVGASTPTPGTAANVRAWAGHRQAFPLGQCHTPLTSLPTLGRALTDGNLHEVGFVNSFLEQLAHQASTLEDDSADEDTKYEAQEGDVSDEDQEFARQSRDFEHEDDDYYSRHKKRRSTRWRSNYPSIKKPKRPCTGDATPPSSSRMRRASVSAGTPSLSTPCRSHDPAARREMRSRSVSSYFAMRRNEESGGCGFTPVPFTSSSSVSACNGSSPLDPSPPPPPPPSLLLPPAYHIQQHPHPHHHHHHHRQLPPEWRAVAGSTPLSSSNSSSSTSTGGDLPAVPSPPPHGPISLPAIQASYYYYDYDSDSSSSSSLSSSSAFSCELPSSSSSSSFHHGLGGGAGRGEGDGPLLFRHPGSGAAGLVVVDNASTATPAQPVLSLFSSSSSSSPSCSWQPSTAVWSSLMAAPAHGPEEAPPILSSSSSSPSYNFWPVSAAQPLPDDDDEAADADADDAHDDGGSSALMGGALPDDEEVSWLEDLLRLEPRSSLEDTGSSPVVTQVSPDASALASAHPAPPGLPQGGPSFHHYHHQQPHHYKQQQQQEEEEEEGWQAPIGVPAPGEATPFAELCGF